MEFVGKIFHLIDFIIACVVRFVNIFYNNFVLIFWGGYGIMKLVGYNVV